MSERHVTACIDGSAYSQAVCDAAAWASLRLDIGLTFVHVIDKTGRAAESDVSGQIGLGSREHLLAELAQLDEQRARLEREQGRIMLDAACERAAADGVANAASRQRHGALAETLVEMESETRLLVLGKRGETATEPLLPHRFSRRCVQARRDPRVGHQVVPLANDDRRGHEGRPAGIFPLDMSAGHVAPATRTDPHRRTTRTTDHIQTPIDEQGRRDALTTHLTGRPQRLAAPRIEGLHPLRSTDDQLVTAV